MLTFYESIEKKKKNSELVGILNFDNISYYTKCCTTHNFSPWWITSWTHVNSEKLIFSYLCWFLFRFIHHERCVLLVFPTVLAYFFNSYSF